MALVTVETIKPTFYMYDALRTEPDYLPGEKEMLLTYGNKFRDLWIFKVRWFSQLHKNGGSDVAALWDREYNSFLLDAHTYAFNQTTMMVPNNITHEAAVRALMTVVPMHPDQQMPPHIMRDRLMEGFGIISSQAKILQRAFWTAFPQYKRSVDVVNFLKSA